MHFQTFFTLEHKVFSVPKSTRSHTPTSRLLYIKKVKVNQLGSINLVQDYYTLKKEKLITNICL